jgi:hypothetical protein
MKKLVSFLMAIMMISMVGAAWAATDVYTGSEKDEALVTGTSIPLTKSIVLFNTEGSQIREPKISFTYTVTPVDTDTTKQGQPLAGVTVTDDGTKNVVNGTKTPVTVNVYDGVAGAFTSNLTLTFSDTKTEGGSSVPNKQDAAVGGTELEKTGNLTVTLSAFQHAGIYRYKISEVAHPSDVTTVGLDARTADYNSVRYLDVYIKNNAAGTGLEMYGAVIFKSTDTNAVDATNGDITTSTEKTTGFEPSVGSTGGPKTYENDTTVDKYHTFNLEVNKTIAGGLADKTHDFPFEITLTGDKTASITADYSKTGATWVDGSSKTSGSTSTGYASEPTTIVINTNAKFLTPALSNDDSVKITGIPVGTTVLVKETNDTYDQYTPSITTQTGFTSLALNTTGAMAAGTGATQLSAAATISDKTQNSVIGLTNTLAEVSPTGYVSRFAPYALILVAGIALLVVAKKRKPAKDDEE